MSDFVIENGVLRDYTGAGGAIAVPSGVTAIGDGAFHYKREITSVTLPRGVKSIGKLSFLECRNLKAIALPEGLLKIESSAFDWCTSLQSIAIPDSVTDLGSGFNGCTALRRFTRRSGA